MKTFLKWLEEHRGKKGYEWIYVGSKGGSSFWYIGSIDELINRLYDFDDYFRRVSKVKIARTENKIKYRSRYLNGLIDYVNDARHSKHYYYCKELITQENAVFDLGEKIYNEYKDYADAYEQREADIEKISIEVASLKSALARYKEHEKTYTHLEERNVVEEYDRRFVAPLGKIVNIEGYEVGNYWDLNEFEKKGRGFVVGKNGKYLYPNCFC